MRIDQELVKRNLCESRTEAQEIIESGNVLVNGATVLKQTKQVNEKDLIEITSRRKFVSRGGDKLEGILLDVFGNSQKVLQDILQDKNALDIGSSTGGFSDCLLSYGVSHIDAVDVGTMQLHEKLRQDKRISLFENTDIRDFKSKYSYDIIVADLSFIPLNNVFDCILKFGKVNTKYFLLIKPQFEVGRGNTKKGIVKDYEIVEKVLSEYKSLSEKNNFKDIKVFPCRIKGGEGNQEYFLYLEK